MLHVVNVSTESARPQGRADSVQINALSTYKIVRKKHSRILDVTKAYCAWEFF